VWFVSFRLWSAGRRGKAEGEAREEKRRLGGVVEEIRMDMDWVAGMRVSGKVGEAEGLG
jgi:hypothetical protein